jgi:hypothetical protein
MIIIQKLCQARPERIENELQISQRRKSKSAVENERESDLKCRPIDSNFSSEISTNQCSFVSSCEAQRNYETIPNEKEALRSFNQVALNLSHVKEHLGKKIRLTVIEKSQLNGTWNFKKRQSQALSTKIAELQENLRKIQCGARRKPFGKAEKCSQGMFEVKEPALYIPEQFQDSGRAVTMPDEHSLSRISQSKSIIGITLHSLFK